MFSAKSVIFTFLNFRAPKTQLFANNLVFGARKFKNVKITDFAENIIQAKMPFSGGRKIRGPNLWFRLYTSRGIPALNRLEKKMGVGAYLQKPRRRYILKKKCKNLDLR